MFRNRFTYKHTLIACFLSYITQGIVNNFSPLLFVTFSRELGVSLGEISILITVNFVTQIGVDLVCSLLGDRIDYRKCVLSASMAAALGLAMLGVLPQSLSHPFVGLLIATVFCAIGGGLIEVVVSPMVEALPGEEKNGAMSLLHSFYCWGVVGVVLLSTGYFLLFGIENWRFLTFFWALVPLVCGGLFLFVPVLSLNGGAPGRETKKLLRDKAFLPLIVLMLSAGASEVAISQWVSLFAERGLHVSKTLGDLLGPCAFAVLMGLGRVFFGIFGDRIRMERALTFSFATCAVSYLIAVFSPTPIGSLLGCALCGLSVALLWPGTYRVGAVRIPDGGTRMFALFALAGDLGCTFGPDLVGGISDAVENGKLSAFGNLIAGDPTEVGLKTGILLLSFFPLAALLALWRLRGIGKRKTREKDE